MKKIIRRFNEKDHLIIVFGLHIIYRQAIFMLKWKYILKYQKKERKTAIEIEKNIKSQCFWKRLNPQVRLSHWKSTIILKAHIDLVFILLNRAFKKERKKREKRKTYASLIKIALRFKGDMNYWEIAAVMILKKD